MLVNEGKPREQAIAIAFSMAEHMFTRQLSKGGEGSGNFGHDGRPGQVGGSSPSSSPSEPKRWTVNEVLGHAKAALREVGARFARTDLPKRVFGDEKRSFGDVSTTTMGHKVFINLGANRYQDESFITSLDEALKAKGLKMVRPAGVGPDFRQIVPI
jgi:hypothetical protein